jgi:hypothetical protein
MFNHEVINIDTNVNGVNHPDISQARDAMRTWWIQSGILPQVGDVFNDNSCTIKYKIISREFRNSPDNHVVINARKEQDGKETS